MLWQGCSACSVLWLSSTQQLLHADLHCIEYGESGGGGPGGGGGNRKRWRGRGALQLSAVAAVPAQLSQLSSLSLYPPAESHAALDQ